MHIYKVRGFFFKKNKNKKSCVTFNSVIYIYIALIIQIYQFDTNPLR
jgi:hypothetical protein